MDLIFAAGSADEAMSWVAACGVEAKWNGEDYEGWKGKEIEKYAQGMLKGDDLTLALYKGIWHALEPGKSLMASEMSSWT